MSLLKGFVKENGDSSMTWTHTHTHMLLLSPTVSFVSLEFTPIISFSREQQNCPFSKHLPLPLLFLHPLSCISTTLIQRQILHFLHNQHN